MLWNILKEECRWKNFRYRYHDDSVFYRCQWDWPHPVFVCLRVVLAAYVIYGFIHELVYYYDTACNPDADDNLNNSLIDFNTSIEDSYSDTTQPWSRDVTTTEEPEWDSRRPWCVYFTLWTYMILLVHFCWAAVLSILFSSSVDETESATYAISLTTSSVESRHLLDNPDQPEVKIEYGSYRQTDAALVRLEDNTRSRRSRTGHLAWYFKVSWLLSDLITPSAPIVTGIYFLALYDGGGIDIYDTNVHILNTVFMLVDHLISPRPIKLLHVPAPALLGVIYLTFNLIFWSTDHENHVIYSAVLDWNEPGLALLASVLLVFGVTPLVQLGWVLLYKLKRWTYKKIYLI